MTAQHLLTLTQLVRKTATLALQERDPVARQVAILRTCDLGRGVLRAANMLQEPITLETKGEINSVACLLLELVCEHKRLDFCWN